MDTAILARLGAGQLDRAFDLLVESYQHRVYRLALAILGEPAAAQDAAQEALIRIWKGLRGFRGQSSLSTWIYSVTRNTALSERSSALARRTVPLPDTGLDESAGTTPSHAPARAGLDVEALVAELRPQYQQVLRLYYMEENSYEEVSRMLAVPLGTVKTLLHRARLELAGVVARSTVKEG